jgi:hypothetical protein
MSAAKIIARPEKPKDLPITEVARQIYQLHDAASSQLTRRPAHLLNMAMAGLKWLVINTQSDMVRLQACKAIIELPTVQARLLAMVNAMPKERPVQLNGDVSATLAQLLVGAKPADLRALEHAESQILPAKPKKTNENP